MADIPNDRPRLRRHRSWLIVLLLIVMLRIEGVDLFLLFVV